MLHNFCLVEGDLEDFLQSTDDHDDVLDEPQLYPDEMTGVCKRTNIMHDLFGN